MKVFWCNTIEVQYVKFINDFFSWICFTFCCTLIWLLLPLLIIQSTFILSDNPPPTSLPYFTYPSSFKKKKTKNPTTLHHQHKHSAVAFFTPPHLIHHSSASHTHFSLFMIFHTRVTLLGLDLQEHRKCVTLCVWKRESEGEKTTWGYCSDPYFISQRSGWNGALPSFLSLLPVTLKLLCLWIQAQWKRQSVHSITAVTPLPSTECIVKFTDVVIQGVTSLQRRKEPLGRSHWVNSTSSGRAGPKGSLIASIVTETELNKHSSTGKPHDLM